MTNDTNTTAPAAAPTPEQLNAITQRAAEVAPASWESVKSYATAINQPLADVAKELHALLAEPMLAKYKENSVERYTLALGILHGRLEQSARSNAVEWQMTVFGFGPLNETQTGKKNRELWGIGKPVEDNTNGTQLIRATFWEETTEIPLDAKPGFTYRVFLGGGFKDGLYQASGDKARTNWKNVVSDSEGVDLRELVSKHFPIVPLAKVAENYSTSWKDLKAIDATLTDRQAGVNDDGSEWFKLSILDNSIRSGQGMGITAFVDKAHTRYAPGAKCIFVGQLKPPTQGKEQYGPKFYMNFMVPVIYIETDPVKPMRKAGAAKPAAPSGGNTSTAKSVDFKDF